jgi:hypothetical protein
MGLQFMIGNSAGKRGFDFRGRAVRNSGLARGNPATRRTAHQPGRSTDCRTSERTEDKGGTASQTGDCPRRGTSQGPYRPAFKNAHGDLIADANRAVEVSSNGRPNRDDTDSVKRAGDILRQLRQALRCGGTISNDQNRSHERYNFTHKHDCLL